MQHKKWKKAVSSVVVLSLLYGGAVSALPAAAAADGAVRFSDVPAGHWAEKHIAKLSLQGIVKGNNGMFKPADNITQQEAVTMAVRFIGKESEVKQDSAVVFPVSFKVDNYFKPYVVLAMTLGLINRDDEFKLAEQDPAVPWGQHKASREWITKLLVKAIGQQKLADELAASPIPFADGGKADEGYAGYINAAASLKLVNGVTADKFDPQGLITRAAMATMFSRAETQYTVAYPGEVSGILSGKDGQSVTVFQEGGIEETFKLSGNTYVYRFDSEKASSIDKLDPNTKVEVIADGDNALYIEQLDGEQQVEKLTGVFDRLVPSENKMWVWIDNEAVAVYYDGKVAVKDASGTQIPVTALTKDSKVEIVRDKYREKPLAVSVTVQSAPVNKSGQGKVQDVQASSGTLQVSGSAGAAETLSAAPDVDVVWQGAILQGGLAQIRVGDTISYEVKNSVVTRITILQTTAKTVTGTFNSASSDGSTITYLKDGATAPEAKFLSDAVSVEIQGLTGTGLSDLVKGDKIELTLSDQDKVTAIKVLNRQVQLLNGATIVSFDADSNILTVRDTSGGAQAVTLSDSTKITDSNGNLIKLDAAEALLAVSKNRKVTVGFTNGKAVLLQFVYKYTGTFVSVNTASNLLNMTLTNGSPFSIGLENPSVQINGKTSAALTDVKPGDTVTILLNATQDKATTIQVHTVSQMEIVSVDAAAKKLRLKNGDQTTTDWSAGAWELLGDKGDKLTFANLSAGQLVNVTFAGTSPVSLKLVPVTIGKIVSVSSDKITVTDYNGQNVDLPLGTAYTVVKNGVTGSSASVLQAGDRVEVRKDTKDQIVVTVIAALPKTFWKFDAASSLLSVKRSSLNDTSFQFAVTANTKFTQGNSAISVSQLADGDKVQLYVYKGTLLEVVKE